MFLLKTRLSVPFKAIFEVRIRIIICEIQVVIYTFSKIREQKVTGRNPS